jgi:hypothetical protein
LTTKRCQRGGVGRPGKTRGTAEAGLIAVLAAQPTSTLLDCVIDVVRPGSPRNQRQPTKMGNLQPHGGCRITWGSVHHRTKPRGGDRGKSEIRCRPIGSRACHETRQTQHLEVSNGVYIQPTIQPSPRGALAEGQKTGSLTASRRSYPAKRMGFLARYSDSKSTDEPS